MSLLFFIIHYHNHYTVTTMCAIISPTVYMYLYMFVRFAAFWDSPLGQLFNTGVSKQSAHTDTVHT